MSRRLPPPRGGRTFAVLLLIAVAFAGGNLVSTRPVVEYGQDALNVANHPHRDVPTGFVGSPPGVGDAAATFCRPQADTQVFDFESHDPMLVETGGVHYLVVGRDASPRLYRSTAPTDPDSWTLLDADYLADRFEFDSLIRVDGRYVAYGNSEVYTARAVVTDRWTKRNQFTGFSDLGAYYDEETGLVHVYYEYGQAAGFSGKKIGHAVSPNGVSNWTVYPPVWTAPDGYGVGDFEVVERNDTLYILGDYDAHHPRYNVSVWVNDDPYTEFTQLDDHALTHRLGETPYGDDYGVGDPAVTQLADGQFLMLANGYANESAAAKLHYYVGEIGVNASRPAACAAS